MRKLFSIIAAILFAGSMMAADATIAKGTTNSYDDMTINGKKSIKMGKSGAGGNMYITVGANATSLTFHAVAWKGEGNQKITIAAPTGVTVSKTEITATANDNLTGNSKAFEVTPESDYEFTVTLTGVGSEGAQLTLTSAKRAIVWAATYEAGAAPTVSKPTFEPKEGNFEGAVTVTLACETEGASIFFTLDESEPATEAGGATQAYSAPFKITETATIKAIAVKGTDKSAVAEKTYTKLVINQYEVKEAIDAGLNKGDLIKVRGVVTNMAAKGKNFATYGSLKIYVKDATGAEGEFQFFNCASLNEAKFETTVPAYDATSDQWADFTSVTDADGHTLRVGDTIVAKGKYELYNSTYELQQGCFLVDIKSAPFVPQTIDITVTQGNNMVKWTDAVADKGWWQIIAQNDDYYVTLSNGNTVTAASGTYEVADLDDDYSYIYDADENKITLASGSVTITVNADESVTAVGQFVGSDGNTYKVDLTFTEVEIISTVNVEIAEWTVIDTYASYGLLGVQGTAEDETMVQFAVWNDDAEAAEDFYGTYTEDDLDYEFIGSGILLPTGGQILIYAAEITVAAGEGDAVVDITAQVLAPDGVLYNITTSSAPTGINNVEAMKKVVKAIENGQLIINVNGIRYNVTGIRVK